MRSQCFPVLCSPPLDRSLIQMPAVSRTRWRCRCRRGCRPRPSHCIELLLQALGAACRRGPQALGICLGEPCRTLLAGRSQTDRPADLAKQRACKAPRLPREFEHIQQPSNRSIL
eukprot:7945655-Lingulodinium_polyedra.AAC.1